MELAVVASIAAGVLILVTMMMMTMTIAVT